jgi:hypothetical protein
MTRCLVCHRPADHAGVFVPYRPARYGGRVLPTALCRRCERKGKRLWMAAIEKVLEAQARAGDN